MSVLVEQVVLVSLSADLVPSVQLTLPPESELLTTRFPEFCFCELNVDLDPPRLFNPSPYAFVLTKMSGERHFVFCKRVWEHGDEFPLCICIVTSFPWHTVFEPILKNLETAFISSGTSGIFPLFDILNSACNLPPPGTSLDLSAPFSELVRPTFSSVDTPFGQPNFKYLLEALSPENILILFSAICSESRVLMYSENITILSNCVFSAVSLLYPFSWEHILVPLLPPSMLSYCSAPMPFVIGLHASHLQEVMQLPLEEILFIDLDSNTCYFSAQSKAAYAQLPDNDHEDLRRALVAANAPNTQPSQSFDIASHAFQHFFSNSLKSFLWFFRPDENNVLEFDRELMVKVQRDPALRKFLATFMQTQSFVQFTDERKELVKNKKQLPATMIDKAATIEFQKGEAPNFNADYSNQSKIESYMFNFSKRLKGKIDVLGKKLTEGSDSVSPRKFIDGEKKNYYDDDVLEEVREVILLDDGDEQRMSTRYKKEESLYTPEEADFQPPHFVNSVPPLPPRSSSQAQSPAVYQVPGRYPTPGVRAYPTPGDRAYPTPTHVYPTPTHVSAYPTPSDREYNALRERALPPTPVEADRQHVNTQEAQEPQVAPLLQHSHGIVTPSRHLLNPSLLGTSCSPPSSTFAAPNQHPSPFSSASSESSTTSNPFVKKPAQSINFDHQLQDLFSPVTSSPSTPTPTHFTSPSVSSAPPTPSRSQFAPTSPYSTAPDSSSYPTSSYPSPSPAFNPRSDAVPFFNPNSGLPSPPFNPRSDSIPTFNPRSSGATPSFNPRSDPAPSFNPTPSFNPRSEQAPAYNPTPSFNPAPSFNPTPSFNPRSDSVPSFNPRSDTVPYFNPRSDPAPSFNPRSDSAPSFNPRSDSLPSFNPYSRTSPSSPNTSANHNLNLL
eukprot:TRINITY_DN5170_c0_g1_i1.p1 TRINITY_DN5170_c0_g1~~TRINITY_DN5170_c0_g1_i1.p1  ORF type:complete len:894 (-),score=162.66 TRINITY_DN5170_c0_g1_i1:174-2855(-)